MTLPIVLLLGSVLALVLGPLLLQLRASLDHWRAGLDGFALVTAGGLAALHLLPEALAEGGPTSILFAAAGIAMPVLANWGASRAAAQLTAWVLLLGLLPHVGLEAALLGAADPNHITGLGAAIVGHRLPVGLFVYSLFLKRVGRRGAWLAMGLLVAATLGGFSAGEAISTLISTSGLAWFQALIGGTLLHVTFTYTVQEEPSAIPATDEACGHEEAHCGHAHSPTATRLVPWSGAGAVLGLGVLFLTNLFVESHNAGAPTFTELFLTLVTLSAPALLFAYVLIGVISAVVRPSCTNSLKTGGTFFQAVRGGLFGLRLSICPSGVLPLYEKLVRQRVPPTAALSFLTLTPALGLDALLLSIPLFGWSFTFSRLGAGILASGLVALLLGRLAASPVDHNHIHHDHNEDPSHSEPSRLWSGLRFGLIERFDHAMPWVLGGLLVAAWLTPVWPSPVLNGVPSFAQVIIAGLVGVPTYLCATGATPLAAIAVYKGLSPGAAIAFLCVGPITNFSVLTRLKALHGTPIAVAYAGLTTTTAIGLGLAFDLWAIGTVLTPPPTDPSPMGFQVVATLVLALLLIRSVFQRGPRAIVQQLTRPIHAH